MLIAGQRLTSTDVKLLATILEDDPLAERLRTAAEQGTTIFNVSLPERERILNALGDPPMRLRGLRTALLAQRDRRAGQRRRAQQLDMELERAQRRASS